MTRRQFRAFVCRTLKTALTASGAAKHEAVRLLAVIVIAQQHA